MKGDVQTIRTRQVTRLYRLARPRETRLTREKMGETVKALLKETGEDHPQLVELYNEVSHRIVCDDIISHTARAHDLSEKDRQLVLRAYGERYYANERQLTRQTRALVTLARREDGPAIYETMVQRAQEIYDAANQCPATAPEYCHLVNAFGNQTINLLTGLSLKELADIRQPPRRKPS